MGLQDRLRQLGANFAQYQGALSAADFGDPVSEYRTALHAVALMDRSALGRIQLGEKDRFEFLQRMSTNDMRNLTPGDGLQTVLTTAEAKIVDLLTVYVRPDTLLCLTAPLNRTIVTAWFRRNIFFRDKVKLSDETDRTAQLTLFGPRCEDLLRTIDGRFAPLPSFHSCTIALAGVSVLAARVPSVAGGGYDLIAPVGDGERLWDALLETGASFGLRPMGTTAFNWLRLAAGQPLAGFELSQEHNPLEARLAHAISSTKGCYTGQEVIARLDTYHKLKQVLTAIELSDVPHGSLPLPLRMRDQDVGTLTSAARLPDGERVSGLGYVRTRAYEPGAQVSVDSADGLVEGTLVPLPDSTDASF